MKAILLGILAFVVIVPLFIGMWLMGTYNGLIQREETVTNSWAQVESQYQRRYDLIPGLVNSVKGVLRQEQEVFGAIAEARTRYAGTNPGTDERVEATNQVESALARLLVIMENYPVLRSNEQVVALMDELAGTENRINVARDRYNEQVRDWNVHVKTFPRSLIAGMFGFEEKPFFEADEGAEDRVEVDLEV